VSDSRLAIKNWLDEPSSSYFDFRKDISRFHHLLPETPFKKIDPPTKAKSIAIVVTFNPDEFVLKNIALFLIEFETVYIVDNSPENRVSFLTSQFPTLSPTQVFYHGNQNGLAGALNLGIRNARKNHSDGWLFFFDQDTELKPNFVSAISEVLLSETQTDLWNSVYCSDYDDRRTQVSLPKESLQIVPTAITSGTFLRVEAIERIGPFIDEMFIDSLDHEFCLRARRFGFTIKLIRKQLMYHSLGELQLNQFLWKKNVRTHNHSPFRWYFFTRNFVFSCEENFPLSWKWILNYGKMILKTYAKALVYEEQKMRKTNAALLGLWDGNFLVFGRNHRRDLRKF
jgi:rhamnosyltransferase